MLMEKRKFSIQESLSLGYLYLILLGIISDGIYFKSFGIDILDYSGISDVMISPVNILLHDFKILFLFAGITAFAFLLIKKFIPWFHRMNREKAWYGKITDMSKADAKVKETNRLRDVAFVMILVTSLFVGFGLGRGEKTKQRIDQGTFKHSHVVTFSDGTNKEVRVIGQNSSFLFHISKGEKEVSISPILSNIRSIKELEQ